MEKGGRHDVCVVSPAAYVLALGFVFAYCFGNAHILLPITDRKQLYPKHGMKKELF